jgi:hypothetical protein
MRYKSGWSSQYIDHAYRPKDRSFFTDRGGNFCLRFHDEICPRDHPVSYLSIYLSVCGSTALVDLGHFFSFLTYTQSVGFLGRRISPVLRSLPTHRTTQTRNKRTQTSVLRVWFELTIPTFKRAKTVHALDRAAIVIGHPVSHTLNIGGIFPWWIIWRSSEADHSPPSSAKIKNEWSYTSIYPHVVMCKRVEHRGSFIVYGYVTWLVFAIIVQGKRRLVTRNTAIVKWSTAVSGAHVGQILSLCPCPILNAGWSELAWNEDHQVFRLFWQFNLQVGPHSRLFCHIKSPSHLHAHRNLC